MSSMQREIVSFNKGTFDITLSAASHNTDLTICLQAGKIKVSAIVCGCMFSLLGTILSLHSFSLHTTHSGRG
jgi:hypothetical protein